MPVASLRVLLADDHALFRDGVSSLLSAWDIEVVGQAADGAEAITQALALQPDLILLDIQMPRLNGLQAVRQLKAALPHVKVVMLTVSDKDRDLFEAIEAGADGYLLKDMCGADFASMLTSLARGESPISPSLASKLLREFGRRARDGGRESEPDELTEREKQVLSLIARGATNKEAAQSLAISENTVSYHVKNILGKLHAHNRAEAAALAVREGLVAPDSPRPTHQIW